MSTKSKTPQQQFPGQHDDEAVQFVFHQHPLVMRKALIGGLLLIVAGVLPLDFYGIWYTNEALYSALVKLAIAVPLVVALGWGYRWIGWYYTVYIVTDRRIMAIKQQGLFDRQVTEWQLDGISNVNYHIGGFQAVIFSYGDITARTYLGDLEMKTIHKPAEIHEQLVQAVRRAGGGAMPPSASSTQSSN